jgi:hypothetical protein
MKKSIFAVALVLGTSASFAQDLTSEMGETYLPESGDWAIGVDATPFLQFAGNLIGGNGANTAPTWNFLTNNQTITGKYFTADDMAYRGSLRLGFGSNSASNMVADRTAAAPTYPALPAMVENTMKMSTTSIGLSGGIEYRKGSGRLQGFYGGELGIALSSSSTTYTYGNALAPTAATPVFVDAADDFGTGNITADTYGNAARVTESKGGSSFGIGIRGFIGAEYFVLPKLAVGGEFGWGLVFGSNGASSTTMESTDGATVGTQTLEGNKASGFGIDTDNVNSVFGPAASLRMTFHF